MSKQYISNVKTSWFRRAQADLDLHLPLMTLDIKVIIAVVNIIPKPFFDTCCLHWTVNVKLFGKKNKIFNQVVTIIDSSLSRVILVSNAIILLQFIAFSTIYKL